MLLDYGSFIGLNNLYFGIHSFRMNIRRGESGERSIVYIDDSMNDTTVNTVGGDT